MIIDTARGSFGVHQHGDGPNHLLLLHPLALSGAFWHPLAEALAESSADLTVLALDCRGHGGSVWDGEPFTVEDMADDAAAVVAEVAGVGPVGVVGMSMGGCVAVSLAERHPLLVDRLVLADTTATYGPDRLDAWAERAAGAVAKPRIEQVAFQIERWFSAGFREERPDEVQRVIDIFVATDSEVHAAAALALGAFDGVADLGAIEADTLVVVGEEDYATPVAMAEALAAGITEARLVVLDRARHLSLLERRDWWTTLDAFLAPRPR